MKKEIWLEYYNIHFIIKCSMYLRSNHWMGYSVIISNFHLFYYIFMFPSNLLLVTLLPLKVSLVIIITFHTFSRTHTTGAQFYNRFFGDTVRIIRIVPCLLIIWFIFIPNLQKHQFYIIWALETYVSLMRCTTYENA